ncbi:MAG: flagellar hook-length control protein FliK [Pseudomonadota bacterium]
MLLQFGNVIPERNGQALKTQFGSGDGDGVSALGDSSEFNSVMARFVSTKFFADEVETAVGTTDETLIIELLNPSATNELVSTAVPFIPTSLKLDVATTEGQLRTSKEVTDVTDASQLFSTLQNVDDQISGRALSELPLEAGANQETRGGKPEVVAATVGKVTSETDGVLQIPLSKARGAGSEQLGTSTVSTEQKAIAVAGKESASEPSSNQFVSKTTNSDDPSAKDLRTSVQNEKSLSRSMSGVATPLTPETGEVDTDRTEYSGGNRPSSPDVTNGVSSVISVTASEYRSSLPANDPRFAQSPSRRSALGLNSEQRSAEMLPASSDVKSQQAAQASSGVPGISTSSPLSQTSSKPAQMTSVFLERVVAVDAGLEPNSQAQFSQSRVGDDVMRVPTIERSLSEPAAARPIISQVIQSITRATGDGSFEIRLQPEELGRIRLTMTTSEIGVSVQINAERAETLDILRRNIELLGGDLEQQGFTNLSFTFGSDNSEAFETQSEEHVDALLDDGNDHSMLRVNIDDDVSSEYSGRIDIRI